MRKLKTEDQIIQEASTSDGYDNFEDAAAIIVKMAQRDALEFAAEYVKGYIEDNGVTGGEHLKQTLLKLVPK